MSLAKKFLERFKKDKYSVGDIVTYDGNARGITPRISKAEILSVSKGFSTHGNAGEYIYKVRDLKSGNVFSIDHFQIMED